MQRAGGNGQAEPAPAAGAAVQPAAEAVQQQGAGKVRDYPDEPRVGVGVVILRQLPPERQPEVLLIRRAKEPAKGEAAAALPVPHAVLPPDWLETALNQCSRSRHVVLPWRQPGAGGDAGGLRGAGDAGGDGADAAQRPHP